MPFLVEFTRENDTADGSAPVSAFTCTVHARTPDVAEQRAREFWESSAHSLDGYELTTCKDLG